MNIASAIEIKKNPKIPELAPGDTVRVSARIVEGAKERTQPFQGVVIKQCRSGISSNFTVRRVAYGVGVERTFPLYSTLVEKVEVIRHGKVRRAKLYYLRERSGKSARLKERRISKEKQLANEQLLKEQTKAALEEEKPLESEEMIEAVAVEETVQPEAAVEEPKTEQVTDEAPVEAEEKQD